jgi:error-prone DNA polymerase
MVPTELHASSAFSFLRGSSLPEELVRRAAELGLGAVALVDRDGLSGAPRFFKAARRAGIRPMVGAELTLAEGGALTVLVENRAGYQNLCRLITGMKAGVAKGKGVLALSALDEPRLAGLVALAGADTLGTRPDPSLLLPLRRAFGEDRLLIEVQRHRRRAQERTNRALLDLAAAERLRAVATGGVRHAHAAGRVLLDAMTCIREKRTLATAGRLLADNAERHLRAPARMAALFADQPRLLREAEALAERLTFTLDDLGYEFPLYPLPPGETADSYLWQETQKGALDRYRPFHAKARRQIAHELALIKKLKLAGYFLIVWDIVNFCRREGILVQGRGSAANSAVCYSLGLTAVDPVGMDLLFERFLSEERGEWPDIDLDLPSGDRRERVIQYVYARYGARGAAMTANVITYRDRSAAREMAKALDIPPPDVDKLSRFMRRFEFVDPDDTLPRQLAEAGFRLDDRRVKLFARLVQEVQDLPRHLGQHSGGMVVAQGQLDHVVPLEPASMPGRVVVQWDKDDCADMGIVKVDLLGLGMMSALQDCLTLLSARGVEIDLAHLPPDDPQVYGMLQRADTVGLFQVESRAQMATLPRLLPRKFYDLVVEVAIIRPGPIVGRMVHPYLARRAGEQPVTYPHPSLEPVLARTLGVPLFQEQVLRMAMVVAGFTGGEAEELRRAMGMKRSVQRMAEIEVKLRQGMAERGIVGAAADEVARSITSFALYGFPESHAASFALLAYASAYLRAYHGAAFLCALLNNQPMGFYHPFTLVKDAQRHGVRVLPVCVARSDWDCTLEQDGGCGGDEEPGSCPAPQSPPLGREGAPQRGVATDLAKVRMGLRYVAGLRAAAGKGIVAARGQAPFASLSDLIERTGLHRDEWRQLAEVGALNVLGLKRRSALWQVERATRGGGALFAGGDGEEGRPSPLPEMDLPARLRADVAGTSVTVGPHPLALERAVLSARGVVPAGDLRRRRSGERVRVAGAVICRQRPGTAKGFVFLTLEDETGLANIIVRPDLYRANREVLVSAPVLEIDGVLQSDDALTVRAMAVRAAPPPQAGTCPSRDFR